MNPRNCEIIAIRVALLNPAFFSDIHASSGILQPHRSSTW